MLNRISTFKDRLNEALEIMNIRPVDLSKRTGISESTISQYRSGYAEPKSKKLDLIARTLSVDPSWLMGLDVPMTISRVNEEELLNTEMAQTLASFTHSPRLLHYATLLNNLDESQKDVIYNMIDALNSTHVSLPSQNQE